MAQTSPDQALAQGDGDRRGSSVDREARIDVLEMCLDCGMTYLQSVGDGLRRVSVGGQLQDLPLSWCYSRVGPMLTVHGQPPMAGLRSGGWTSHAAQRIGVDLGAMICCQGPDVVVRDHAPAELVVDSAARAIADRDFASAAELFSPGERREQ